MKLIISTLLLLFLCTLAFSQITLTEDQAVEMALAKHPALTAARQQIRQLEILKSNPAHWEPAHLYNQVGADPEFGMFGIVSIGVQQRFPSGKQTKATQNLYASRQKQALSKVLISESEVVRQIREIYHHLSFLNGKAVLNAKMDSVYRRVAQAADIRYKTGDVSLAEKLAATDKARQIQLEAQTVRHEIEFDRLVLGQLLGLNAAVIPLTETLHEGEFSIADTIRMTSSASMQYGKDAVQVAQSEQSWLEANLSPAFNAGVFGQYLGNGDIYPGWQIGINVPLFRKSLRTQSQAALIGIAIAEAELQEIQLRQNNTLAHLLHEQEKHRILLEYYNTEGLALAAELLRSGELNYRNGELSYADFVQLLEQAAGIELAHLENLYGLNQTIIQLKALIGE